MFRMWAKVWKDNHLVQDLTIEDNRKETRTHKVFHALDEACHEFNLARPIWLDSNVREFKKHARVRFRQDSFMEEIEFDYLELQILEED